MTNVIQAKAGTHYPKGTFGEDSSSGPDTDSSR
ncbi:hypothetical protein ACVIU7_002582 [Bradyrhizobium liaoningense]